MSMNRLRYSSKSILKSAVESISLIWSRSTIPKAMGERSFGLLLLGIVQERSILISAVSLKRLWKPELVHYTLISMN